MNLLTALHEIVSQLRSRRHQTHGGAHAADTGSDSETNARALLIENPETWHPEDWLAGSGACESIAPDERDGPSKPTLPEVVAHDGQIIMFGGHGTDWIRADPEDVIDREAIA